VAVDGQPLTLTSHEFKVLALLMQRGRSALAHRAVRAPVPAGQRARLQHHRGLCGRLRKKLPAGSIETVRGLGYRLVPAPAESLP
jgi:two-component system OmpR family response regulator